MGCGNGKFAAEEAVELSVFKDPKKLKLQKDEEMGLGIKLIWDDDNQEVIIKGFRRKGDSLMPVERSKGVAVGDALVAVDGKKVPKDVKGAANMIREAAPILQLTMKAKIRDPSEMVSIDSLVRK